MFSPFERMLAFRYLRARKAEGFVSVIAAFSFTGIMLGVATLIIVMSVMNGFRAELFDRILGLNGHLNVYARGAPLQDYTRIADQLGNVQGVIQISPQVEGQGLLTANGVATGVVVRGISQENLRVKPVLSTGLIDGDTNDFAEEGVAIGVKLAERLKVQVGDYITILSPRGKSTPFGTMPRSQSFSVALVFDVGMFEYNNNFVFMPLATAQGFFQFGPNTVSGLEIISADIADLEQVKQDVVARLSNNYVVYDWRDANSSFVNALEVERNVMFLILTMIILVAAFNIISSMIMLVKDKSRDIAILRTMGATRQSMLKIFILTGASIGFLGTFFGAMLGIAFAVNIEGIRQALQKLSGTELFSAEVYFLSQLPAIIAWSEVMTVIGMALVISILATLYPAWRAARLNPVEALRYE
ncbi:MAG: lipoprotein-releasing ABC transporter permease subunit [Pseudomonadota bacterium]